MGWFTRRQVNITLDDERLLKLVKDKLEEVVEERLKEKLEKVIGNLSIRGRVVSCDHVVDIFGRIVDIRPDMAVLAEWSHAHFTQSKSQIILQMIGDEDGQRYYKFKSSYNVEWTHLQMAKNLGSENNVGYGKYDPVISDWLLNGRIPDGADRAEPELTKRAFAMHVQMFNGKTPEEVEADAFPKIHEPKEDTKH